MQIQLIQTAGAGTKTLGLPMLDAWAGLAVQIVAPVGGSSYLHQVLDQTGGAPLELTNKNGQIATLANPAAGSRYRIQSKRSTAQGTETAVTVVCVSRDAAGGLLNAFIAPTNGETAKDADPLTGRGIAQVWERFAQVGSGTAAAVDAIISAPGGAAQVLPVVDSTLEANPRSVQAGLPGTINPVDYRSVVTHTIPDGTRIGEPRTLTRTAGGRGRLRFISESGRHVAWLNTPGAVHATWDGTDWKEDNQRIAKVYRPEDYADPAYPNVGTGTDAEADTRAIERMRDAIHNGGTDYDPTIQPSFEFSAEAEFAAPVYLLKRPIDWYGTDYSSVSVHGRGAGWSPGRNGTTIRWAGGSCVVSSSATLTFNRASRTIVRTAGSFLTDGFGVALAAAQADGREMWIHVYKESAINRRIHRVEAVTASTITVKAPRANPVVGFDTDSILPSDEVGAVGYSILEALPMFRTAGASGYEFSDLVFHGRSSGSGLGQVSSAIHIDIEPDVEERTNASNNRISRVLAFGFMDHVNAAAIRIGRPGADPPVGSQCDTVYIRDVYTLGNLGTPGHLSSGVVFEDGNNTKSAWIENSAFGYHRYGIDHWYASEVLGVSSCRFESCWTGNVRNAGILNITACQSERAGAAIRGLTGVTNMSGCSWNTANTDGLMVEQRALNADGSQFINYGVQLEVLSVDAGADTLTVGTRGEVVPANGQLVVLRHMTLGEAGLPGGTSSAESYWLDSVTPIGGLSYTCKLFRTAPAPGGTLVNLSTGGVPGIWALQPAIFRTAAHDRAAPDGSSISLRGCNVWAAEKGPHIAVGSGFEDGLNPTNVQFYNMFTRASWQGCQGISHTRRVILPDACTVPPGNYSLTPQLSYPAFATDGEILYSGKPAVGTSAIRFDFSRLKVTASTIQRLNIPYRTGILRVRTEVVPDSNGALGFAAPGLTSLTVQVGIYDIATGSTPDPDNLLTPHAIHTGALVNARDRRWGFTPAQYGVDLPAGGGWWQYNTGTDRGWEQPFTSIDITFTPVGGSLAALTQGALIVYLTLEQVPKWERS